VSDARPDDARLAAWRAFLQAHAAVTAVLEHELETAEGLSLSWYDVLLQLNEASGSMRMQELARKVLLSKSGLTRLIDRMEKAGLVARQPCPSDRRGWLAVLTPEGKAQLRRAAPAHLKGVEEHFGSLVDEREAEVLRTVFDRILDHVTQLGCAAVGEADEALETPLGS
jgi:DNA-binding MarR family transcriptional regulator